jgi:uncharacterized membrane protein
MMILAEADASPLWIRIVFPLLPWAFLLLVVWLFVRWQSRVTAKLLRRHMEAVEAKLDRLIEVTERINRDK